MFSKNKCRKNCDFYFSVIDNENDEKHHIYLGNSSEECLLIENSENNNTDEILTKNTKIKDNILESIPENIKIENSMPEKPENDFNN